MKKIIYILMFCLFFAIPNIVKANEYYNCDQYDLIKLQKLASNVTTTYEHQEVFPNEAKYGIVTFKVYIDNLDSRIYLKNTETNAIYTTLTRQVIIDNVLPGTNIALTAFANDYGCHGEELVTMYINVPSYNKFYTDELCETYPKNKLCKKWSLVDISYDEFKKRLLESERKEEIIIEEEEKKKTFIDYFLDVIVFLDKYKYPIFGAMIIIPVIGIIMIKISKRKDEFDLK